MSLNLCIDIDGTITDAYYWLDYANEHFGTCINPHHVTTYDIHHVLNVSREDYMKFYEMNCEKIHGNSEPRVNTDLVLWRLAQQHNVSYVTARDPKIRAVTEDWFKKNGMPNCNLHMLGSHYKVEKARELNCDIFIEDRYENAIQLALAGIKVLLIDCSYNRQPLIPGITRVFNWIDIYEEIEEYNSNLSKKTTRIA
ncbi:MAG: 5' nucleotidase, NT5C type [Bacillota bacterium]